MAAVVQPAPLLTVDRRVVGDRVIIYVAGELDIAGREAVRRAYGGSWDVGPRTVELDIADLDFLDCGGLRSLVELRRRVEAAGRSLVVSEVTPQVARLLELTEVRLASSRPTVSPGSPAA